MYKRLLCLIVIMAFTATAWADDLFPPGFRGDPQTVKTHWGFNTDNVGDTWTYDGMTWEYSTASPDVQSSGNPSAVWATFSYAALAYNQTGTSWAEEPALWLPTFDGRTGVWDVGQVAFNISNWDDGKPFKEMRFQMTYYTGEGGSAPEGMGIYLWGGAYNMYDLEGNGVTDPWSDVYVPTPSTTSTTIGNWTTTVWDIHLEPNPSGEWLKFGPWWSIHAAGGTTASVHMYLDQLVIDTISYPEPATVALLGLGSLALIRRKRR